MTLSPCRRHRLRLVRVMAARVCSGSRVRSTHRVYAGWMSRGAGRASSRCRPAAIAGVVAFCRCTAAAKAVPTGGGTCGSTRNHATECSRAAERSSRTASGRSSGCARAGPVRGVPDHPGTGALLDDEGVPPGAVKGLSASRETGQEVLPGLGLQHAGRAEACQGVRLGVGVPHAGCSSLSVCPRCKGATWGRGGRSSSDSQPHRPATSPVRRVPVRWRRFLRRTPENRVSALPLPRRTASWDGGRPAASEGRTVGVS